MTCPDSQQYNDLGCGVRRCCDDVSCVVDVSGPCVCATYYETATDAYNYSFIATCDYNSVTGTPLGSGCYTDTGPLAHYPYSCYCRLRTTADVGNVGDQLPGDVIFPWAGGCGVFEASSSAAPSATPTSGGEVSATSSRASVMVAPAVSGFGSELLLVFVVWALVGFWRL